jgi:hypothetical protein
MGQAIPSRPDSVIVVWRIRLVLLGSLLVSHAAWARDVACPLPAQRPMIVTQLFFGRDIAGRAPVSDAEWAGFVADVISRQFPDGFTVQDGDGEWRDPKTHNTVQERTKILTVAQRRSATLGRKLKIVTDAYDRQFRQTSVGVITMDGCGAF